LRRILAAEQRLASCQMYPSPHAAVDFLADDAVAADLSRFQKHISALERSMDRAVAELAKVRKQREESDEEDDEAPRAARSAQSNSENKPNVEQEDPGLRCRSDTGVSCSAISESSETNPIPAEPPLGQPLIVQNEPTDGERADDGAARRADEGAAAQQNSPEPDGPGLRGSTFTDGDSFPART